MGTNYYVYGKPPCECCGRPFESKHIGKSSAGWCFALHVYPDEGIHDLPDWERLLEGGKTIYDEYGHPITTGELWEIITDRDEPQWERKPYPYNSWEEFHEKNHSQQGPKGLIRSRVDGRHCIGHGIGTWDLIIGEFS